MQYEVIVDDREFRDKAKGLDGANEWCRKTFGSMYKDWQYYFQGPWKIYVFNSEEDATLFRLTWL